MVILVYENLFLYMSDTDLVGRSGAKIFQQSLMTTKKKILLKLFVTVLLESGILSFGHIFSHFRMFSLDHILLYESAFSQSFLLFGIFISHYILIFFWYRNSFNDISFQ